MPVVPYYLNSNQEKYNHLIQFKGKRCLIGKGDNSLQLEIVDVRFIRSTEENPLRGDLEVGGERIAIELSDGHIVYIDPMDSIKPLSEKEFDLVFFRPIEESYLRFTFTP